MLRTALLALVLLSPAGASAQGLEWRLLVEAGGEVDTNAHRVEVQDGDDGQVVTAPLARLGARYRARYRNNKHLLSLNVYGGTKLFPTPEGQGESVAIVSADGAASRGFGDGASLSVRGNYYNAIAVEPEGVAESSLGRNFTTGALELALSVGGPANHRVGGLFGGRIFQYKPDPDFDWIGEHYGITYLGRLWARTEPETEDPEATLDLRAGYRLGRRAYDGTAFTNGCAPGTPVDRDCFVATTFERRDLNHAFATELVYTGNRIWSARYELSINDSNSFGQSLIRQRLEGSVTTELFGSEWLLTAKAAVLLNIFRDPLLVARDVQAQTFVSIDDENRNSVTALLRRPFRDRWSFEARYSLFSNEFATDDLSFRRQTFYAGLSYAYGEL